MERNGDFAFGGELDRIADEIVQNLPHPALIGVDDVDGMSFVVDDMLLVDDDAIKIAMSRIETALGITPEPAGAVPLAAATVFSDRFRGQRIALLISGSNT